MNLLNDKIKELERLCGGCKFEVKNQTIRILEYGRLFTVDLMELGITAEQWLDDEIAKRPEPIPLIPDEPYNIFCSQCGKVNIGYGNYHDQMTQPNSKWYCPQCGNNATFDDESYEAYYDGKDND